MSTDQNPNNLLKPRQNSRWWIWAIAVVIIIVGILVYRNYSKPAESPYITEVAAKQDLRQSVDVSGTIKAAADIKLNFKTLGTIQSVNVKVGDQVKAGQILSSLDSSEMQSQLRQSQAAVSVAQAQLQQILEGTRPEEIKIQETNVQNAINSVDSAQKNYDLTKITIESDKQTSQIALDNANQSLIDSQKNLENIKNQTGQNIKNTIDSNLNQINLILISEQAVYNNIKEMWDNKTYYTQFKNMDFSTTTQADNSITLALGLQTTASNSYQSALISKTETDTQKALNDTLTYTQDISDILKNINVLLYQDSARYLISDLTTLKTRQTSNEATNNSNLTSIQNLGNAIANTKISNQISIDNASSQITNFENQVKTAQENLDKINVNSASTLQKALDTLNNAKDQLAIQNTQLELKKAGSTAAATAVAQAQVAQALAAANTIQTQINNLSIVAPVDGLITQVNVNPGEQSNSANPIIQMQSNAKYEINADIAETDIDKIKLGNKTIITFDALSKEEDFSGTVVSTDPSATIIQGVVYYHTKVVLDTQDPRVKPGMTANIEIITGERTNVLAAPNQSIKTSNNQKTVEIVTNNKTFATAEKNVTIGLRGNTHTEITSGLNGGEQIVLLKK